MVANLDKKLIYSELRDPFSILNEIETYNDPIKLFTVTLAILHDRVGEITSKWCSKEVKDKIRSESKEKIKNLLKNHFKRKTITTMPIDPKEQDLIKEISLLIIFDYCLVEKLEEFLFNDVFNLLESYECQDLFYHSLGKFIALRRVHIVPNLDTLEKIIAHYSSKKDKNICEQFFTNLKLAKYPFKDREKLLPKLMSHCVKTDMYTSFTNLCLKSPEAIDNIIPFQKFREISLEAKKAGKTKEYERSLLRCLWFVKIVFKRKMMFWDDLIPEERTNMILNKLWPEIFNESILKEFYQVQPGMVTVLISMIFQEDLTRILSTGKKSQQKDNNQEKTIHEELYSLLYRFFEKEVDVSEEVKRTYIAFIASKIIVNPMHNFISERMAWDLVRYLLKNHSELDGLIILDFKTNFILLRNSHSQLVDPDAELNRTLTKDYLVERKGSLIEKLMIHANNLLNDQYNLNEGLVLCNSASML